MKPNFKVMFLIVLCGVLSIAVFNPIIGPLSRDLGLSEFQSGCLVSATGLFWLLGGYFWGRATFSSSKRLLSLVMLAYVATVIAFAWLADYAGSQAQTAAGLFWIFLALRIVSGFFFGGIPAIAQAYIMSWTTPETRTRGMALFGTANGLGFVLGPALSGVMASVGLTAPMYVAAALLVIMKIWLWLAIPNEGGLKREDAASRLSPLDSRIRYYLWAGLLITVTLNILQVTIGFFIQDSLGLNVEETTRLIGYGLAVAGVMVVVTQIFASKYMKRRPERMLRIGLAILTVALVGLLSLLELTYALFIAAGIGFGFALLGFSASSSVSVRDHEQRGVASFVTAIQGSGAFLGPAAGTALYTAHMNAPYSVCALLIGLTLLAGFARRRAAVPSPASIGGEAK